MDALPNLYSSDIIKVERRDMYHTPMRREMRTNLLSEDPVVDGMIMKWILNE